MDNKPQFKNLFQPGRIGTLEIKNRIIMPAMTSRLANKDGSISQALLDYYEERAKGGPGMVVVEDSAVEVPSGISIVPQICLSDDRYISGLRQLATVITRHGVKSAIQLGHAGGHAVLSAPAFGPSEMARPGGESAKELTSAQIAEIVDRFAQAARRVKEAGFDGIEVQAAHGHLVAQFLSPALNKRTDNYGGLLPNRARILLEVIAAVRRQVGTTYPFWCKINGEEAGAVNGFTLKEAAELAKMVEEAGVDAIVVSGPVVNLGSARPYFFAPGWGIDLAKAVKSVTKLPVATLGRMTPELGEQVLQDGKVDFVVMGRAMMTDPGLATKLESGKRAEVRPCIACHVCLEISRPGGERLCTVNPALGRERACKIARSASKKKVIVVGAGPSGLEAASAAAMRGHEVIIFERQKQVGGKMVLVSALRKGDEIKGLIDSLAAQIDHLGVTVRLGTELTPSLLIDMRPDVVIAAVGARPESPNIPGITGNNVFTSEAVLGMIGADPSLKRLGQKQLIIGNGFAAYELADFLSERGSKVTIIQVPEQAGYDDLRNMPKFRAFLSQRLLNRGVTILADARCEEVTAIGAAVSTGDGKRQTIEVDGILTTGTMRNQELSEKLISQVPVVIPVGDCSGPRGMMFAFEDGFRAASRL